MIVPSQICCVIETLDMRRGLDSLSQWVQASLDKTPCDGTTYAFSNRSRTRLKLLIWDGTGVWCCLRRLHRGSFVWPTVDDRCWMLTEVQWNWLIKGVDWQRLDAQAPAHWQV